jgi:hypothetical protein
MSLPIGWNGERPQWLLLVGIYTLIHFAKMVIPKDVHFCSQLVKDLADPMKPASRMFEMKQFSNLADFIM